MRIDRKHFAVGLLQVNLKIPDLPPGDYSVVFTIRDLASKLGIDLGALTPWARFHSRVKTIAVNQHFDRVDAGIIAAPFVLLLAQCGCWIDSCAVHGGPEAGTHAHAEQQRDHTGYNSRGSRFQPLYHAAQVSQGQRASGNTECQTDTHLPCRGSERLESNQPGRRSQRGLD